MITLKIPETDPRYDYQVTVVGAGGTGARLIPLLVKALRHTDTIHVVDPDRVGQENLLRQHFGPQDIGRYKAEIMASRYNHPGGPTIRAYTVKLDEFIRDRGGLPEGDYQIRQLVFGCVDNNGPRQQLHDLMVGPSSQNRVGVYIDMGNAMRTGQITMAGRVRAGLKDTDKYLINHTIDGPLGWSSLTSPDMPYHQYIVEFDTISELYPNLLQDDPEDTTPGCAIRIDTQTTVANQLAATFGFNIGLWFIGRTNVMSGGTTFSATTATAQPHPFMYAKMYPATATTRRGYIRVFATREGYDNFVGRELNAHAHE